MDDGKATVYGLSSTVCFAGVVVTDGSSRFAAHRVEVRSAVCFPFSKH
ncbi:MAG: hypothetical protein Q7T89_00085 [Anaerolineales bacterium]|nr:hypothetical protein [Anaerolineales bacterium]